MTDPERLIHLRTGSLEAELLESAEGEVPPPKLLERTLAVVGAASATAVAAGVTKAALGSAKAGGLVAGGSIVGGGLTGSIVVGAVLGLVTVGAAEVATGFFTGGSSRAPMAMPSSAPRPPPSAVASFVQAPSAVAEPEEPSGKTAVPASSPRPKPTATPRLDVERSEPPAGSSVPVAPQGSGALSTLAAETAALDTARRALLGGDARGAIEGLDRYDRMFQKGQLAREAASLRAEAESVIKRH